MFSQGPTTSHTSPDGEPTENEINVATCLLHLSLLLFILCAFSISDVHCLTFFHYSPVPFCSIDNSKVIFQIMRNNQ